MARILNTAHLSPSDRLPQNVNDWVYNGLDCCVTLEVLQAIKPQLDNLTRSTYEFSKALQGPVLEMTMRGLLVDKRRQKQVLAQYRETLANLISQLNEIVTEGVGIPAPNWRSNKQVGDLLYGTLGIPIIKKRSANGFMVPTVHREALEKIALYFIGEPIAARLILIREYDKKVQFLENEIDSDGRARTNLNIAGTNTGRLASSLSDYGTGGNQQNVDRDLRSVFISDPGMKFCNLDLEQGDSRNVGATCWNTFLNSHGENFAGSYLNACESGDLHTQVARMVWPGLPWGDDPSKWKAIADDKANPFYRTFTRRDITKRLGHGTNFLGQPPHMAQVLRIAVSVVQEFQRLYFAGFPVLSKWHEWTADQLKEHNTLTTLWGRRRQFFGRPNDPKVLREAIAYSPQSMTAEEINKGLLNVFRYREGKFDVWLHLQVHDSILVQYHEEQENEVVPWLIEQLHVPLELNGGRKFVVPAEAKVGWNWGDKTKDNPDGLVKWTGHDDRKRTEATKLDVRSLL